ncbi:MULTISPECIES: CoA transferase [unclassified Bradyrhizobium]|uniref:CaiB/BaiF CoA transferase family protein n=1 Tax=unclassified Bradyrhizobium TaxID=2631580 RepID=UPI002479B295|nr:MULTISPECIES: CoA transferase [unclassified Bradyrhizobium]WGS18875.1 CoA transferase [Bradyrhizobium sp. ISRA463]WGS25702.1 CoA transferase [Bradyrhizobium sp. ISRA464]
MSGTPTKDAQSAPAGPLAGVRIIDLTSVMMGPYATMILGDYGADVIKVESPDGDVMRHAAPMRHPRMGAMYLQGNRNKRSIVLDLKKAGGRAALLRLAATADVFVHNVRPAAMARLKLGADDLLAVNSRLIYASLHGFGETGPYAGQPAYDDLIQGLTALPALTGRITGEPRYSPATMADRIVGLNALHAILAALFHRERTGEGQAIEIPMFETMAQFVLGDHMAGRSFEPPVGPPGYSRLLSPDRRPYQTSDGYICALVYSDKQWNAFFAKIGLAHEADRDPRLNSISARTRNYDFVYDWFSQMMKTRTTAEWMRFFEEADIPHAPLHDLDSLIDDPHLTAVGLIQTIEHPTEGRLRVAGPAATWSRTPPSIRSHPPGLGEHGREILREAGLAEAEIAALIEGGALIEPAS